MKAQQCRHTEKTFCVIVKYIKVTLRELHFKNFNFYIQYFIHVIKEQCGKSKFYHRIANTI